MTDHIADSSKMVLDLDKLEALADAAIEEMVANIKRPAHARCDFRAEDRFHALAHPKAIKSLIASAREAAAEIERLKGAVGTSVRILSAIPKPTYVDGNPTYFPSDDVPEDIFTALSYLRAAQMDGEGK